MKRTMTREEAKKEYDTICKVNTFGWAIDELADINQYKIHLYNIINKQKRPLTKKAKRETTKNIYLYILKGG